MKFNLTSLAFYTGAIGAVVALFSFATAYGEANLKAPTKLDGRYRIAAQALPGCLKARGPNSHNQAIGNLSQWLIVKRRRNQQNPDRF